MTVIQYGKYVDPTDRELMDINKLSSQYGNINYDQGAIENIYRQATDAKYAAQRADYQRTANQYYSKLGTAQNALLDTLRKNNAQAVASGASRGMSAATQLSSILGMSQQTAGDALLLAQEERALTDKQAAEQAQNTRDALEYANQQKLAMGTLGANLYATDANKYIGELGQRATVEAANVGASATGYAADRGLQGTVYNADRNLEGTKYNADQNLVGVRYNADRNYDSARYTADSNYKGTVYNADKNYAGTTYAANANQSTAKLSADATKYAAQMGYASNKYQADAAAWTQSERNKVDGLVSMFNTGAYKERPEQMVNMLNELFGYK